MLKAFLIFNEKNTKQAKNNEKEQNKRKDK